MAIQLIKLTSNEFDSGIITDRKTFERHLIRIILTKGLSISPKINTVFFYPESVSTAQRHRIHTFGQKYKMSTKTRVKNGNRCISVQLTPQYVIDLVNGYYFGN